MGSKGKKGLGAQPPFGAMWQIGKTAASIRFVNEAETALGFGRLKTKDALRLQAKVDAIKNGDDSLVEFLTVDAFLASPS